MSIVTAVSTPLPTSCCLLRLLVLPLLLGFLELDHVGCLFVTDIDVPQIVDFRDNVTLSCSYDMSGHTLNSVKWYKNEMEFFRYSPLMHPVYMKFPVDGVQLSNDGNFCNEFSCQVSLTLSGINSSGTYKCEVSGDAPHFKLTAREANMSVEGLPQRSPLISNFNSVYHYDELVEANCSSDFSSLPTKLSWYVNNIKASFDDLQPKIETTIEVHKYNLRRQTLPLNFYANDVRFLDNHSPSRKDNGRVLVLKCSAEIENHPQLRRETTLSAILLQDDEYLKNQKLINSGATFIARMSLSVSLLLLTLPAALGITSIQPRCAYGAALLH